MLDELIHILITGIVSRRYLDNDGICYIGMRMGTGIILLVYDAYVLRPLSPLLHPHTFNAMCLQSNQSRIHRAFPLAATHWRLVHPGFEKNRPAPPHVSIA